MTPAALKALEGEFAIYVRDEFEILFADTGLLQMMPGIEDNDGESMLDAVDTKFGSGVSLVWTREDTKAATALAKKIKGDLRDQAEGMAGVAGVTDEDWLSWFEFDLRARILSDRNKEVALQAKRILASASRDSPSKRTRGGQHLMFPFLYNLLILFG
jgi:hypothetical protein